MNLASSTTLNFETTTENRRKNAAAASVAEKKRASLDARHRYLLEKFATFVDEKVPALENSLLIGNKLDLVNEFFAEGGSRKVMFFWQPPTSSKVIKKLRECVLFFMGYPSLNF